MNLPSTPDQVIAESVVAEPLDQLLRQIVNGYFVLTDGNGAVSKWSEPAELLFGRAAEEILGESFFATLIGGTLPPAGQAWRMFLDTGEPPRVPGTVELTGRNADGEFPLEAVFVPVKLDEGFDFSLFLEDLSFDLPLNLMLMRMRQQHPVVVRALRGGIEPEAQPWGGGRTAGTLVVFKPLQPTPWVEAELARREAERAAADAQAEERLTNPDPGIQGSVNDLDDAAAVVARLLGALERIDDLERVAGGLPAQLEESRRESDRRAEALRSDVQRALSAVPSQLDTTEQLARVERLERARMDAEEAGAEQRRALAAAESLVARLSARVDQVEQRSAGVSDERLAEAVAAAESRLAVARTAVESRVAELERAAAPDLGAQLERVRAEHEEAASAARAELAAAVDKLSREREHEREADRVELASALEVVERVRREADAVREQLAAVTVERAIAGEDHRRLDELQTATDQLAARVEALRAEPASGELRDAIGRHDAALQELAELVQLPAQISELRVVTAAQLTEVVSRHDAAEQVVRELEARQEATAAELAGLRDAASDPAALEAAQASHDAVAGELRDAVARQDAAVSELREAQDAAIAELREAAARAVADVAGLRDVAERHDAEISALREATTRHDADVAALREAEARHDADVAALREVTARYDADIAALREAGDLSELRAAEARHDADLAALRDAAARHDAEVADLRRALADARPADPAADPDALPRLEVETLVGDARRELSALREQVGSDIAALRERLDGTVSPDALERLADRDELSGLVTRAELDELRGRLENLALRDELDAVHDRLAVLAARDDVDAVRARLDGLAGRDELSGLAPRDEVDALWNRLDGLAGRDELSALAPRDAVDALWNRLDGFAARDELAGLASREQLDELREDLAAAAARHELDELRAAGADLATRLDELAGGSGQELAQEAIRRIEAVDRGAGTVLTDVRELRERVEEALSLARSAQETGRTENEELRELIARLGGELEVARGGLERAESEALGARQAASAADQAAAAARTDAATAREEAAAARRDLDGDRERLSLLGDEVARLTDGLSGVRETASETRVHAAGLGERLAAVDRDTEALRAELGSGRERLAALDAQVGRLGETVGQAEDARRAADERAAALRSEISQVRDVAESADAGLRALREELVRVRDEALSVRTEFAAVREAAEAAKADARRGDERVEAMQSELAYALASLEELKQGLSSAGQAAVIARREAEQARKAAQHAGDGSTERVTEVFQQILGMAAARGGAGRQRREAPSLAPKKPEPVQREPRHGFDDAASPLAILGLDGKFKELNPAFAKLVGYQEHEFAKAAWPSPHDRRDYKDQLEQLAQLKSGELREVEVQSTYMHGQGLMVPVVGKLSAMAGEDGLPSHLVLTAEDRHHM